MEEIPRRKLTNHTICHENNTLFQIMTRINVLRNTLGTLLQLTEEDAAIFTALLRKKKVLTSAANFQ